MNREERIAKVIKSGDPLELAILWHDGKVGSAQARRWRTFHRLWLEINDYPTMHIYPDEPIAQYDISVCTSVMNRIADVQQTLPENLKDPYPNKEFILLDYGSTDGLGAWIKAEMREHLESGLLKYYWTDAKYFDHPHSKNIAMKQGTGDILMNLDGDNLIKNDFLTLINRIANHSPSTPMAIVQWGKTHGNIAMWTEDFYAVNGYDESLHGRGPSAYNLQLHLLHERGAVIAYYPKGHRDFVWNEYGYAVNMEKQYQKYKFWHDRNIFRTYFTIMSGTMANRGRPWGETPALFDWKGRQV